MECHLSADIRVWWLFATFTMKLVPAVVVMYLWMIFFLFLFSSSFATEEQWIKLYTVFAIELLIRY